MPEKVPYLVGECLDDRGKGERGREEGGKGRERERGEVRRQGGEKEWMRKERREN